MVMGAPNLVEMSEIAKRVETEKLAESIVPKNEPERKSSVEALTKNLLDKNFEEVLKILEKII